MENRFAASYRIQFSYTYSKFMEALSYLNDTDALPYRVISPQDRPHRLTAGGIWELPIGRGRSSSRTSMALPATSPADGKLNVMASTRVVRPWRSATSFRRRHPRHTIALG